MKIILDTGMRFDGVYLFHKEFIEKAGIPDTIDYQVGGAGSGSPTTAAMGDSLTLKAGEIEFPNQMVVISRSPTTQGFPTDGVIGSTLFKHFAVEIDYDSKLITLHDSSGFTPDDSWTSVPLALKEDIPFLKASVNTTGESVPIDVYIDLGAGEAVELLVRPEMKFKLPENLDQDKYLGTGLSGDITGKTGRIHSLKIGPFELFDVPSTFPPAEVRSKQEDADGIICNDALRRFNVVFDYANSVLYLKPNGSYRDPFE